MEQGGAELSKVEQGQGNKQSCPIPICKFQAKNWVMTWHNYPDNVFEQIEQHLVPLCKQYVFGKEKGKSGNSPHIQGAFVMKSKIRQSTIWKMFETMFFLDKMSGKWEDQEYCVKEAGEILTNYKWPKPLKIIKELYGWQKDVLKLVKDVEPNDRDIIWVYGGYGIGKTQFAKYMIYNKIAFGPLDGEKRHILSVVSQNINEECFIIYLSADESKYQKNSMFDCIENIKDGLFMSHFGVDNTGPVFMNSPHIIVLANERPDFEKTKMDQKRFKIYNVGPHPKLECSCEFEKKVNSGEKCIYCKNRAKKAKSEKGVTFKI